jgi:glycosyltransferase involved in cell wall biosynthesis
MEKEEKLFVVIPAYNEALNIESVVRSWYSVLKYAGNGSKLIIADSKSTDETNKILKRLKNEYPNIEIISDSLKEHGPKLIYMYKYAIENKADWIFQTDSDRSNFSR